MFVKLFAGLAVLATVLGVGGAVALVNCGGACCATPVACCADCCCPECCPDCPACCPGCCDASAQASAPTCCPPEAKSDCCGK